MSLAPPPRLGAPARFREWRAGQDDQLVRLLSSHRRFKVNSAPVGVGKSLVNFCFCSSQAARMAYLTSTRGLQDQLNLEFASVGLVDVRGMSNYLCLEAPKFQCDKGPCLDGGHCDLRFRGCLYYDAVREARLAKYSLTNYALWMTMARNNEQLGARDVLVLDEAHEAPTLLSAALRVELNADDWDSHRWPKCDADEIQPWKVWAGPQIPALKAELVLEEPGSAEHRRLKRLLQEITRIAGIEESERWVWEFSTKGVTLEPIWPAPYAEQYLFRGIESVVLSSATIRPKTLEYLGLKPEQYDIATALSPFPPARRPIMHLISGAAIKWGMDEYTTHKWLNAIDSIIEGRLDRKGIIHAVSFERARTIAASSRFASAMFLPNGRDTRQVVARFKAAKAPAVLVSPSVHTGYDFPYDAARYQIVAKMPFLPIGQSPLLSLRAQDDQDYADVSVVETLEQMAGRVMRAEDDLGETFIVDDQAGWFHKRKAKFFSGWYREAYRTVKAVPPAPVLDRRR